MKFIFFLFSLCIGFVLGIAATFKTPDLVLPYVPEIIKGKAPALEGKVMKKEITPESLLITINTEKGGLIATFTNDIKETNLLIDTGDSVQITLDTYQPFLKNPEIAAVKKQGKQTDDEQPEKKTMPALSKPRNPDPSKLRIPSPQPATEKESAPSVEQNMDEIEIEENSPH